MKFTINGFSQKMLLELGLDSVDSLLLRYFIDFRDSGSMAMEIIDDKPYYWLKYSTLAKELPIIGIKSNDTLRRRLKKLEKAKVLEHYHKKENGSFSFYGIGDNYKLLISNNNTLPQISEGTTQKSEEDD